MSAEQTHIPLWHQFVRFAQQFTRAAGAVLQAHGVTPQQFLMLMALHELENPTQQELADTLAVTKGNVSQMLKVMERDGLIQREVHGNGKRIVLTTQARELFAIVEAAHEGFIADTFGTLSDTQQTELRRLLTQLDFALVQGREAHCEETERHATHRNTHNPTC